jgi:hypothetical protein
VPGSVSAAVDAARVFSFFFFNFFSWLKMRAIVLVQVCLVVAVWTRCKKIRASECERGIWEVLQNASGNAQLVLYVVFSRRHRHTCCRSSSSWSVLCTYSSFIAALLSIFSVFSWTTNTLSLWNFLGGLFWPPWELFHCFLLLVTMVRFGDRCSLSAASLVKILNTFCKSSVF